MSELSKQALLVDNNQSFPNNNAGAITPSVLRAFNTNMIDSTVNQTVFNAFSSSVESEFASITSSITPAITASSLITASFDNGTRNLTFTKGDSTTFAVNIPDVSGSATINTGSLMVTGSVSGNVLTFTKGDATTFNLTVATGSASTINTGSFATTGSNAFVGNQTINGASFGTGPLTGTASIAIGLSTLVNNTGNANIAVGQGALQLNTSGIQNVAFGLDALGKNTTADSNTGLGAAAGRENQTGQENVFIGWTAGINSGNVTNNVIIGARAASNAKSGLNTIIGWNASANLLSGSRNTILGRSAASNFASTYDNNTIIGETAAVNITGGNNNTIIGQAAGADIGSGSQNIFIGQNAGRNVSGSNNTLIGANVGVGSWNRVIALSDGEGNIRAQFINNEWDLTGSVDISGSLTASLAQGFTYVGNAAGRTTLVATSSFGGGGSLPAGVLSSSVTNFVDYSASVDTRINSIVTGTGFATTGSNTFTGDQTFIDGANNFFTITDTSGSMMLVGKTMTSSSLHISSSAAAVGSGAVNLIFKPNNVTADTIISGSNNIFQNPAAPTAGFKRYLTSNNIALGGGFPQISASMAYSPNVTNNYFAGGVTIRGPVSASLTQVNTNNVLGTINIGTAAATHAERLTGQAALTQNVVAGQLNLVANQSEIRALTNVTQNNINGFVQLNLSSSATIFSANTINDGNFLFTNQFSSGGIGFGQTTIGNNTIGGSGNTLIITGSQPTLSGTQAGIQNNILVGSVNTAFVNSSESRISGTTIYHQMIATGLIGQRLIVTGSSNTNDGTSFGSAFVGRWNASDGVRDRTSDIIFAVGTGQAAGSRKTGFHIDSGSNTFVEGTFNVSGSSAFNGNVNITGSLLVNGATISTVGFATTGSNSFNGNQRITGSLTISGSIITVDRSGNDGNLYMGQNALGMGFAGAQPLAVGNSISVAIGNGAMRFASGSNQNVAIGNNALLVTTGSKNFAMGSEALSSNTTGNANIGIGTSALTRNTTGESNTAIGDSAGFGASGSFNTYLGVNSGYRVTGSFNSILGSYQGVAGEKIDNNIILSDGQGQVRAQYSGSSWFMEAPVNFTTGSNQQAGTAVLDGGNPGTVTVNNTLVTANSIIMLTKQTLTNSHMVAVTAKSGNTFTITSTGNGDADTVAWFIINNS